MVADGEIQYFFKKPEIKKEALVWKKGGTEKEATENLSIISEILEKLSEKDFTAEKVKNAIWKTAEEKGRGNVLWPLRVSLSGKEKSPDPFILCEIFGREETLRRIADAIVVLSK
jgi:glutamyl/glutaminyl-tRNA synthetase